MTDSKLDIPADKQQAIESAVFKRLLEHLDTHKDVQNIDLMITADFCRNCLSKWMVKAAEDLGETVSYDDARERVYGMPYEDWKEKYQTEATEEQMRLFKEKRG